MNTDELPPVTKGEMNWAEWIVGGLVFAAAVFILLGILSDGNIYINSKMSDPLNNGRQIYLAMRNYAIEEDHKGEFPTFKDPKTRTGLFTNSNEAFESLFPNYLDDKRPISHKKSAWCKTVPKSEATKYRVLPGENDWVYVRGLKDSSNPQWPLLANAFAPGTTTYVTDPGKPGGVWKGTSAVVIWAGGSAEIVETNKDSYFVKRSDKPSADAFQKDGEWLEGDNVQLLYPQTY